MKEAHAYRHPAKPLQTGKVFLWVLLWLTGMALIGFLCVTQHIPNLEARIQQQVKTAIAPLHDTPLKVSVSGYTATLEGEVADVATEQRIISAAVDQTNVRAVNSRLAIQPALKDPLVSAELSDDTPTVTANVIQASARTDTEAADTLAAPSATAPSQQSIDVNAPEQPEAPLTETAPESTEAHNTPNAATQSDTPAAPVTTDSDNSAVSPGDSAPSDASANTTDSSESTTSSQMTAVLESAATDSTLKPTTQSADKPGIVSNEAANTSAEDATANSDSLTVAKLSTTVNSSTSPASSAQNTASLQLSVTNNALRIRGTIGESDNLGSLIDTAIESLNVNFYINELKATPNTQTASWAELLEALLPSLRNVRDLAVSINGKRLQLRGNVPTDAELNQIGAETTRLFTDYSVENQLVVILENSAAKPAPSANASAPELPTTPEPAEPTMQIKSIADDSLATAVTDVVDARVLVQSEIDKLESTRILFRSGSARLTEDSVIVLVSIADILRRYPTVDVAIDGHTDSQGSTASNLRLSQARANSVRDYLVSEGISELRISAYGFGESLPLTTNDTKDGRSINRRIEFNF